PLQHRVLPDRDRSRPSSGWTGNARRKRSASGAAHLLPLSAAPSHGAANRLTNASAVSATVRPPLSIVRACPRSGISTISVTPVLRSCFLKEAFAIVHGTV